MIYDKITLEFLKAHNACDDGIQFVVDYDLIGFPFNRLHEIKGDNNYNLAWLYDILEYEYVYENGLVMSEIRNKGLPTEKRINYEYDINGCLILSTSVNTGVYIRYEYEYLNGRPHLHRTIRFNSDHSQFSDTHHVAPPPKVVEWTGKILDNSLTKIETSDSVYIISKYDSKCRMISKVTYKNMIDGKPDMKRPFYKVTKTFNGDLLECVETTSVHGVATWTKCTERDNLFVISKKTVSETSNNTNTVYSSITIPMDWK